jgi:monothiol glutaredoxin
VVGTPSIELSQAAADALRSEGAGGEEGDVHLDIRPGGEHDLYLAPGGPGDVRVESQGLAIWVRQDIAERADGIRIDFLQGDRGIWGFRIHDSSVPAKVQDIGPDDLRSMMDAGTPLELLDVRTTAEIELARIEGSRPFAPERIDELTERGFETTVVLYCHQGPRSRAAAERLVQMGFRQVYNLVGGIDGWSLNVDPKVRRY